MDDPVVIGCSAVLVLVVVLVGAVVVGLHRSLGWFRLCPSCYSSRSWPGFATARAYGGPCQACRSAPARLRVRRLSVP